MQRENNRFFGVEKDRDDVEVRNRIELEINKSKI